ncbi:unnamed protein product [Brachionus calyciflorus]|uniref:MACPF domain-containing protein n=1 Tax=Brachionus calyciflorus TaxID=104777 RepID=A0A813RNH3_9BILA|nr:unnamed protein product [Brachionus calyciflorus]
MQIIISFFLNFLKLVLNSDINEYEQEIDEFKKVYMNDSFFQLIDLKLNKCNLKNHSSNMDFNFEPCILPIKKRSRTLMSKSINKKDRKTRISKRMVGMLSKLGNLASFMPSQSDGEAKNEDEESSLKSKVLENSAKLHISNDISFNGFDEFKFGDVKVSVVDDEMNDATGTSINIDFPLGIGLYIANECYREINQPECEQLFDRSKNTKQKSCGDSMIPSAHVIGTGFLISKDGVDKTRRKSLITRLCNKPIKYGGNLIPDGITIAEIYDTEAHSVFFTDASQLATYLSSSYGLSITNEELDYFSSAFGGGIPLLSLSLKRENAKLNKNSNSKNQDRNSNSQKEKNVLLSLFEINIIRYALFIENVRSENLDPFFLIDFMSLPDNYFLDDAVQKYEKFLFRYGTHYIHSAEFGGQILFENTRTVESGSNINEELSKSWDEIQKSFGSSLSMGGSVSAPVNVGTVDAGGSGGKMDTNDFGERKKQESFSKSSENTQKNWTSVFLQSQGGNINVAKLVTRLESNTGDTLLEWLRSIPRFPKAFKVKMRPINELLNFNVRNVFIGEFTNQTCQRTQTRKCIHGTTVEEFQNEFEKRRRSLEFAIEIFRHRNDYQFTDLEIEAGTPETCIFSVHSKSNLFPSYEEILNGTEFKIVMQLDADYYPFLRGEEIYLMYHNNLWFSKKRDENYNFLRTYKMPEKTLSQKIIVVRNLIFDFDVETGELIFREIGINLESHSSKINLKKYSVYRNQKSEHWSENGILQNTKVAQASYVNVLQGIEKAKNDRFFIMPCNLDWSSANSRRFAISLKHGKCLRFIASSYGDIFVVIATNPNNEHTWYFVQISSYGVAFYRAGLVVKYSLDARSGSLKNPDLFRRFFICINYEKRNDNIIGLYMQYGIIDGYDSREKVHLSYFDSKPLEPRYYMFGSYDAKVFVYDISVNLLSADVESQLRCSGDFLDAYDEIVCKNLCHDVCIGCTKSNSSTSCVKCRYDSVIDDGQLVCLDTCPFGFELNSKLKICEDIDECMRNDTFVLYKNKFHNEIYKWKKCDEKYGSCLNTIGSYECVCKDGYDGDGFVCEDLNECDYENTDSSLIADCPDNSECINRNGGYECKCLNGFEKLNEKCIDIDECKLEIHECQTNSYCVNKIGSYKCVCNEGYRGNGLFCEGEFFLYFQPFLICIL